MNKQKPNPLFEEMQEPLAQISFLKEAGLDPAVFVAAKMSEQHGFELPGFVQQHCMQQAMLNVVRLSHYTPPPVDPEHDLVFGEFIE
jgi:hypothetical protein